MSITKQEAIARFDKLRRPLYYIGLGLILGGAVALIGLAYVAIQLIIDPSSIPVAQLFLASLDASEPLIEGQVGSQDVVFQASDSLQYLFFAAFGLVLVVAAVSVANGLIVGGMRLVAIAVPPKKQANRE